MRNGSSECKIVRGEASFCGDDMLQDTQEECDETALTTQCDYGLNNCLVCDASCRFTAGLTSFCGDGTIDTANGEACDRGAEPETCDYGATNYTLCGSDCQFWKL